MRVLRSVPIYIADECYNDEEFPKKIQNVLACLVFEHMHESACSYNAFLDMALRWRNEGVQDEV